MCMSNLPLAKFNPIERVVGANTYQKMDPLMAASERDATKRWNNQFDTVGKANAEKAALNARIDQNNSLMYQTPADATRKQTAAGSSLLGG